MRTLRNFGTSALSHVISGPFPTRLVIGDNTDSWVRAGFSVTRTGEVNFGNFVLQLIGINNNRGVIGWEFSEPIGSSILCDIPVTKALAPTIPSSPQHPNGVVSVDHIVLKSENIMSTVEELGIIGLQPRRRNRDEKRNLEYVFYKTNSTIIEVISPISVSNNLSAKGHILWGIAFTCPDIFATHRHLSTLTKLPWAAVQEGRSITTLNTKELDISIKVAFLSPHIKKKSLAAS
jgi:hypothetical protein